MNGRWTVAAICWMRSQPFASARIVSHLVRLPLVSTKQPTLCSVSARRSDSLNRIRLSLVMTIQPLCPISASQTSSWVLCAKWSKWASASTPSIWSARGRDFPHVRSKKTGVTLRFGWVPSQTQARPPVVPVGHRNQLQSRRASRQLRSVLSRPRSEGRSLPVLVRRRQHVGQ